MIRTSLAAVVAVAFMTVVITELVRADDALVVLGLLSDSPAEGRFCKTDRGFMVSYRQTIPGSDLSFLMQPIPGGQFQLGSPPSEANRQADEGPQVTVRVEPFWMGQYEVTWAEYKHFMGLYDVLKANAASTKIDDDQPQLGTFTVPTPLYDPSFTYTLGEELRQPAVSMTQYATKQYTHWLTAVTRHVYRLPSEVEWEYACRGGTTTPFSFGANASAVADYAWFYDNSDDTYHEVGQKKPNPWGLYDMHGNVGEMVLDHYAEKGYAALTDVAGTKVHANGSNVFDRVVRGGAWDQDPADLRCAARHKTADWRTEDPNFPKSPWWFTDEESLTVGFRVIRPLRAPDVSKRDVFYKADVELIQLDVENRLEEGRGVKAASDPRSPAK